MTENDPHDALIILRYVSWGEFFFKTNLLGRFAASGESSLEVLDQPLGTGLSREPLYQTPPLLFGGARMPPPPPPARASQFVPIRKSTASPRGRCLNELGYCMYLDRHVRYHPCEGLLRGVWHQGVP